MGRHRAQRRRRQPSRGAIHRSSNAAKDQTRGARAQGARARRARGRAEDEKEGAEARD